MGVTITRDYWIEAAHDLPGHDGACRSLHGHSYHLYVTVEQANVGLVDAGPQTGMVMDYRQLDALLAPMVNGLDHTYLGGHLEEDLGLTGSAKRVLGIDRTTAELLALGIYNWVQSTLYERYPEYNMCPTIKRVDLHETHKSCASV